MIKQIIFLMKKNVVNIVKFNDKNLLKEKMDEKKILKG